MDSTVTYVPHPPATALQDVRVEHVGYAAGAHAKHARGLRRRNGLAPHDIRGIKLATIAIYSNMQANPPLPILVVALPVGAGFFFLRAKRASGPVPPLELLPRAAKLPGRRSAAILATVRLYRRQANLAKRAKRPASAFQAPIAQADAGRSHSKYPVVLASRRGRVPHQVPNPRDVTTLGRRWVNGATF